MVINALMHGNEISGAQALIKLLHQGPKPRRGKLTLVLANTAAFNAFASSQPPGGRFVDVDMNRLWSPHLWDDGNDSSEHRRARDLWPVFAQADYLLDLHSMQSQSAPMMLCGATRKARKFAARLGCPGMVVADAGHANGRRLIDCPPFAIEEAAPIALLLEAGQHNAPQSVDTAYQACLRLLELTGLAEASAPLGPIEPDILMVSDAILVQHGPFSFARPFKGLDVIDRRRTIIAIDGGLPIRTPYDECILIMPSPRVPIGHVAVRLAQRIRQP